MLVVHHIQKNLLSISNLIADNPIDVVFSDNFFAIQNQVTKKILAKEGVIKGCTFLIRVLGWLQLLEIKT